VGISVEIAHQVHGAMGFTHEHQLHHFTRRLWAWRDEHGSEAVWQARLGEHLCELGADQVWSFIAAGN
jgi:acyl-CoA dehydrogenase